MLGNLKMKINEILAEASILGAIGKGLAKGAVDLAAPGAWDKYKQLRHATKQTAAPTVDAQPTAEPTAPTLPTTPAAPTVLFTVVTPDKYTVVKKSDNKWYMQDGTAIDDVNDIKHLNQMVINAKELAKAKGTPVPKVIQAQSKPTPAPADPAVFTSNRQNPAVFTSNRRAPTQ